jgi:hypothetical protein
MFYDRGNYIQYDDSYMDYGNSIKRSSGYYYPEDANLNNIVYMDSVSFIANVFYVALNYDISDTFGEVSLEGIKKYGNDIYGKAVLEEDSRVNSSFTNDDESKYVIDYYDDYITTTTGSFGGNVDNHILTMYVNNKFIDSDVERDNIYKKLLGTLLVGDIIVYKEYVLLYVGDNTFIYCSGESYDYDNGVDYGEDLAIRYGSMDELNDISSYKYLFSGDSFYVFRIGNNYGTWKLPNYVNDVNINNANNVINRYFNNTVSLGSTTKIRIDKYGSVSNGNDVYEGDLITYTIRITNNTSEEIVIPYISDEIASNVSYVSNNYSDDSYSNDKLMFQDIVIEGNSYRDISYVVRVLDSEGSVDNDKTMLGYYKLNSISYNIGKKMSKSKIISKYKYYSSIESLYKSLYNIEIKLDDVFGNIIEDNQYKEGYSLLVKGLYGGVDITTSSDLIMERCRYIDKGSLVIGDVIIYNDNGKNNYLLYIDDGSDKFFISYDDGVTIDKEVDRVLESLLGMDKFMVIRPSYAYDDLGVSFGELDVDYEKMIIRLKNGLEYGSLKEDISKYNEIIIKDKKDKVLGDEDITKSGDRLEIDGSSYYISLLGDVNGDGYIDTADVLKLQRYILGKTSISERWYLEASYINGDREIDTADVLKLHRFVLGKIKSLE